MVSNSFEAEASLIIDYFPWILILGPENRKVHCLRMCDTKGSTCLLWDIATEKSGLCCYAVRITQDTYVKK